MKLHCGFRQARARVWGCLALGGLLGLLPGGASTPPAQAAPRPHAGGQRPDPPVLRSAVVRDLGTRIEGDVSLAPETAYTVLLFTTGDCAGSGELAPFGSAAVVTDTNGFASFSLVKGVALNDTLSAVARVSDTTGDSSVLSECVPVQIELTYWTDVAPRLAGSAPEARVGEPFTYTVTLDNLSQTPEGPPQIEELTVDVVLPDNVEFVEASAGGEFEAGRVRFQNVTVPPDGGTTLTITVKPLAPATLDCRASVSDTGPYQANNTAGLVTPAAGTAVEEADLALGVSAAPEPVRVGAELTYTIAVTNLGPATAPNVRVADTLPGTVSFVRASATLGTPVIAAGEVLCFLGEMTNGAQAAVTVVVRPTAVGAVTNRALVEIAPAAGPGLHDNGGPLPTPVDPNPTNNAAAVVSTVLPGLAVEVLSDPAFNPQTGLFEQRVRFTNIGTNALAGVRLNLTGLAAGVTVFNASGLADGQPFLQLHRAVNVAESVVFTVEFYQRERKPFASPTYTAAEAIPTPPAAEGSRVATVSGRAPLVLSGALNQGRFLIEFRSQPGARYAVQYRDSLDEAWRTAAPPFTAPADVVQWLDDGPPKTVAPPSASRLYRVLQLPQP
jgi:uncharacterized repeat protein (TIGR01451 family)